MWILILALVLAAGAALYEAGLLTLNLKRRALLFGGSLDAKRASFERCSAVMRRVVRFKESRAYRFTLDAKLNKGTICVQLLDGSKREVLRLCGENPEGMVEAVPGERYEMTIRLDKAGGSYTLDWE